MHFIQLICKYRCSHETTPFEKVQSIAYNHNLQTFPIAYFKFLLFIIDALSYGETAS